MIRGELSIVVLGMMFFLSVVGCSTGPFPASGSQSPSAEHQYAVVVMDSATQQAVSIERQNASYTEDGRLQAYCEIRNNQNSELAIQVQTIYRNTDGQMSDDQTNWQTVLISANAIYAYKSVALTQNAKSYGIRIRLSK